MNSREIILANIRHENPSRPGLNFGGFRISDMIQGRVGVPAGYTQKRWTENDREYYDDPWGNIWERMVNGSKRGEIFRPAIEDWSSLKTYQPPQYDIESCAANIRKSFALEPDSQEKFKFVGMAGWVFATTRYLRKMEVYLEDMALHPEELHRLHGIVAKVCESNIHAAGKAGADAIFFCEDMGTQTGLLFSPTMWREFFGDLYRRLFAIAHEYGLKVLMHSCGSNWQIVPDLLEAGVDCFQFDQPTVYDMPKLAELLRKHKAALWSPIDIQKILATGDREKIVNGARTMYEIFKGGLIFKNYTDLPSIGVKKEWDEWGYQEVLRLCGISG